MDLLNVNKENLSQNHPNYNEDDNPNNLLSNQKNENIEILRKEVHSLGKINLNKLSRKKKKENLLSKLINDLNIWNKKKDEKNKDLNYLNILSKKTENNTKKIIKFQSELKDHYKKLIEEIEENKQKLEDIKIKKSEKMKNNEKILSNLKSDQNKIELELNDLQKRIQKTKDDRNYLKNKNILLENQIDDEKKNFSLLKNKNLEDFNQKFVNFKELKSKVSKDEEEEKEQEKNQKLFIKTKNKINLDKEDLKILICEEETKNEVLQVNHIHLKEKFQNLLSQNKALKKNFKK